MRRLTYTLSFTDPTCVSQELYRCLERCELESADPALTGAAKQEVYTSFVDLGDRLWLLWQDFITAGNPLALSLDARTTLYYNSLQAYAPTP